MKRSSLYLVFLIYLFCKFDCAQAQINDYQFKDFNSLKVQGEQTIYITQGDKFHLYSDNDHLRFDLNEQDKCLHIVEGGTDPIYVQMPNLVSLHLSGFSTVVLSSHFVVDSLTIHATGLSKVKIENLLGNKMHVNTNGNTDFLAHYTLFELKLNASGASNVKLKGWASTQHFILVGASKFEFDFNSFETTFNLQGTALARGKLTSEFLKVNASGVGKLDIEGQCKQQNIVASGVAQLNLRKNYSETSYLNASGSSNIMSGYTEVKSLQTANNAQISIEKLQNNIYIEERTVNLSTQLKILDSKLSMLNKAVETKGTISNSDLGLNEQARQFERLLELLVKSNKNATVKIGGKMVLIRDSKISTLSNDDGSVSVFVNGVEEERYR